MNLTSIPVTRKHINPKHLLTALGRVQPHRIGRLLTEAAILYSSTSGSFVKWICNGSSVERDTLSPLKKNIGKGFR